MHNAVFIFFFFSGFTSLVFEVVWERALTQVFGTTSLALSTLLTAFMAGLAIGSRLGGHFAPKLKRPLLVYGALEGAIGLYALTIPFSLDLLPGLYRLIFDQFLDDFYVFSLLRFAAVFTILVVPTTFMGATLPIVSQWISERSELYQGRIGLLYATNTLGACTGTMLAGFLLLPSLGLSTTNTAFAVSNVALFGAVAAFAWFMARHERRQDEAEAGAEDEEALDLDEELSVPIGRSAVADELPRTAQLIVLFAFGLAGLVAMSYQVLWTRAYVIVLGSSTYSFTVILTTFLLGLSSGSAIISAFIERIRRPVFWFAATQFALAALATVTFFVIDDLPEWLFYRMREDIGAPEEIFAYQFFLVGLLVFIPIALEGMAFPLVIRAIVRKREESGDEVGRVYAVNTVGAIIGSFIAGFMLMPWLGLHRAMSVVIIINIGLALALGLVELKNSPRRRRALAMLLAGATAAIGVFAFAPRINRVSLTRGMFRVYWARELFDPEKLERDDPELLFYEDGLTATTTVERRGDLITLKANGKPEASDGADMATQILVSLAPFLVRSTYPGVAIGDEEVAMVGYGSGVTAGAALQWPLKRLDVIEIEETMVEASHFFDHVNHEPLEDDRMVLYESDGRNFLEYVDETYDVIISEPSNPWIAGVSALFTVEHFRRAKAHLKEDGVFAQWVQLYEMSPENVKVIFETFQEAFPHVHAFSSMPKGTDLILVGSERPITFPPDGFQKAWEVESVRKELKRAGIQGSHEFYGLMFMNEAQMDEFSDGAPLNTDDNGLLEFSAPRDLIRYDVGEKFFQKHYFRQENYGDIRPYLQSWPDWSRGETAALARAEWLAGKDELAADVLEDAGHADPPADLAPPFDVMEKMHLVLHAQGLDLEEAIARSWPAKGSQIHQLAVNTIRGEKHLQAMMYLEQDGEPPRGGFDGEKGLVYAYVLYARNYYRHALEQLEGLKDDGDPAIVESLPFRLLLGHVTWKRRRYRTSWDAFLSAGESLL